LTLHLARYGPTVGIDFSTAAIDAARAWAAHRSGNPTFVAGDLSALSATFDLITLFDVIEHIPAADRPGFIRSLSDRLAPGGILLASTPFPANTEHRRQAGFDSFQIIDEQVELPRVIAEAADAGLQLIGFEAYDVERGSPEFQLMLFTPARRQGAGPTLRSPTLDRRMRTEQSQWGRKRRRLSHAWRLARAGRWATAWRALTAAAPTAKS
jgi:SAM-dependent methyltransferase